MRAGLSKRMTKLENKRSKQSSNRVLILPARNDGSIETPVHGGGRYMIVNNAGTNDEWQIALRQQQQKLLSK